MSETLAEKVDRVQRDLFARKVAVHRGSEPYAQEPDLVLRALMVRAWSLANGAESLLMQSWELRSDWAAADAHLPLCQLAVETGEGRLRQVVEFRGRASKDVHFMESIAVELLLECGPVFDGKVAELGGLYTQLFGRYNVVHSRLSTGTVSACQRALLRAAEESVISVSQDITTAQGALPEAASSGRWDARARFLNDPISRTPAVRVGFLMSGFDGCCQADKALELVEASLVA